MELNEILQVALRGGASDIHLKAGLPPMFRVDGSLVPLKVARRLPPEEISRMAFGIMNDYQKEKFKAQNELDLAYGVPGLGRFRVNVFQQRGTIGVVLRVIPFKISTLEQLVPPKIPEKRATEQRGLILGTGPTRSGQRVLSTLHTLDATETIARIVSAFPPHQQKQVRLQLGSVLRAVVSQRLVPRADGKGRVAAVEVLVANSRVREMIEDKDRTKEIPTAIAQSYTTYGMQTFDQSRMLLFKQNIIAYEEALRQCSNPDDFALRVSGISGTSDSTWDDFEGGKGDGKGGAAQKGGRPPVPPRASPVVGKPGGAAPAKPGAAAKPASPAADDDFQIERF